MLLLALPLLFLAPAHAEEAPALLPFEVRLLGSTIGYGAPCMIRDAPPHGAWTVIYEVVTPGETGLSPGWQLCEIVHSPSLHLRGTVPGETLACQAVAGSQPPRFACDGATPTGDMPVSTPPSEAAPAAAAPDPRQRRGRRR